MKALVTLFLVAAVAVATAFPNSRRNCGLTLLRPRQTAYFSRPANRCERVFCPDIEENVLSGSCVYSYNCYVFGIRRTCYARKVFSTEKGVATIYSSRPYRCAVSCSARLQVEPTTTPRPSPTEPATTPRPSPTEPANDVPTTPGAGSPPQPPIEPTTTAPVQTSEPAAVTTAAPVQTSEPEVSTTDAVSQTGTEAIETTTGSS